MCETEEFLFLVQIDENEYEFDVQIMPGEVIMKPRNIPGENNGCVMMEFEPIVDLLNLPNKSKIVRITGVIHDSDCAFFEERYGTRSMLLGSMHIFMFLSETRWPHLDSFVIQDKSTFINKPLGKKIRNFGTDLFFEDTTYYQRVLNVQPINDKNVVRNLSKLIQDPFKISFDKFWLIATPIEIGGLDGNETTNDKILWLTSHKDAIREAFEDSGSFRALFVRMRVLFGEEFFKCCTMAFFDHFDMWQYKNTKWAIDYDRLKQDRFIVKNGENVHDTKLMMRDWAGKMYECKMFACKKNII